MKIQVKTLLLGATLFAASSAFGAKVTKLADDAFAPLRASVVTKKIRIDRLPLYDGTRAVIELEEFQVWAPGAKVIIHGAEGKVMREVDPPAKRFFRGLVNGDPESFAFFSMDPNGRNVEGLVVTRDKKFAVSTRRRPRQMPRGEGESEATDTFLSEFDELDLTPEAGQGWQCQTDKMTRVSMSRPHATGADGLPVTAEGISGTQSYAIQIGIETDFELYQNAGSNATTLTNYVTNLTGAVSTIYNRDLKTNVTQLYVNVYTSASDPWNATTADAGLAELGTYYHNNHSGPVGSGDIMLSGKPTNSGIAWLGVVCSSDFLCTTCGAPFDGNYGGPYAWAGSIGTGGLGSVPDPNGTQNGVLYGMPSGQQNYWPLLEYAHEFGHVMAGEHTHCIQLTAAEQITAMRQYVDLCYGGEGGCYSGPTSAPLEKGTIMSYCHNLFSGGFPQSRYTFGQATEVSHHQQDDYMLNASGPVGGGVNIVTKTASFTMSTITAATSVPANSTGNNASVTASPSAGATYAWTLTNGTITSDPTLSSITYTAGASGTMTLRATAYSSNKCGVTDTKSILITSTLPAPTGVTAAATSTSNVHVTWNAATGATSYHVYRSSNGSTYAQVGSPLNSPFDDSPVSANTSYLYKVRSYNGTTESGDSNLDVATTVIPTNGTLTPGVTLIRAVDITEARTAVDALRKLANNGVPNPGTYTDPTLNSTIAIKRVHIIELRNYIDAARSTLFLSPMSYTDPTITVGVTTAKAQHTLDIRAGVQ